MPSGACFEKKLTNYFQALVESCKYIKITRKFVYCQEFLCLCLHGKTVSQIDFYFCLNIFVLQILGGMFADSISRLEPTSDVNYVDMFLNTHERKTQSQQCMGDNLHSKECGKSSIYQVCKDKTFHINDPCWQRLASMWSVQRLHQHFFYKLFLLCIMSLWIN